MMIKYHKIAAIQTIKSGAIIKRSYIPSKYHLFTVSFSQWALNQNNICVSDIILSKWFWRFLTSFVVISVNILKTFSRAHRITWYNLKTIWFGLLVDITNLSAKQNLIRLCKRKHENLSPSINVRRLRWISIIYQKKAISVNAVMQSVGSDESKSNRARGAIYANKRWHINNNHTVAPTSLIQTKGNRILDERHFRTANWHLIKNSAVKYTEWIAHSPQTHFTYILIWFENRNAKLEMWNIKKTPLEIYSNFDEKKRRN